MAIPSSIAPAFVWGRGGQALSYEELMRLREQEAQQAAGGIDTSPVGHWTQGAARVADALVGAVRRGQLDRQATEANDYNSQILNGLLASAGQSAPVQSTAPAASDAPVSDAPVVGDDIRTGIVQTAQALGIDPVDLATSISYETGGTFDPTKAGPTTQWGQHRGLIQFGEPQAKQYGVDWNNPVGSQLGPNGAVANYLRATGVKPGMGLMDIYSAINAGGVGRYGASDANNGGAPGTVADKVNNQMAGHRQKAMALLGGGGESPAQTMPYAVGSSDAAQQNMPYQPGGAPAQLQMMGGDAPLMPAQAQQAVQVASADNGNMNPILMALAKRGGAIQDQPAAPVQQIARALAPSQPASQQVAQASPNQQRLMTIMSDPLLPPQTRSLAASMLQNQMEAQQQANDPLRRLQLERAELENQRLRQPQEPAEIQNLRTRAAEAGLQPGSREYQQFMMTGGRGPLVQVNTGDNSSKFNEESDKAAAGRLNTIVQEGNTASQFMGDIQQLAALGQQFQSGATAQWQARLGPYAEALGVDVSTLGPIQAYNSIVARMAPQMRPAGSGSSSDFDARQFLTSLPNIGNTPEGNKIITDTFQAIQQNKMMAAEIASRAYTPKEQGGISWQEAEKQIRALPNPYEQFRKFRSSGQSPQAPQPGGQPVQQPTISEGMTASNPQTGETIIFRGGKWVPLL